VGVRAVAHRLRGALSTVSGPAALETAERMESVAAAGSIEGLDRLLEALELQVGAVLADLPLACTVS
jgi:HPt (histidine-containing phosphotransfer) domain-containing protein